MENYSTLHLDEDEATHLKQIEPEIARMISLANDGALLSLAGITDGCKRKVPEIGSPTSIEALLLVKAANLVRLATMSLSLGYYTGCSTLLRAAFESVAYLFLFIEDPDEIKLWLKLELHPTLDPDEKNKDKREQLKRAKDTFTCRARNEKSERDFLRMFWEEMSQEIHVSAEALAKLWGLEPWELLPHKEFESALEIAGDDVGYALDLLSWRAIDASVFTRSVPQEAEQEETVEITPGHYRKSDAFLLASVALLLSHRMADVVFLWQDILELGDADLKADFEKWHREVKRQ